MQGLAHYTKVEKPWGEFEQFTLNEPCTVKVITMDANQQLSLQLHKHRDEEWRIVRGTGFVIIGEDKIDAKVGDEFFVPRETKHRICGGPDGVVLLEIALGQFDESDIVRFEDDYGRVPTNTNITN
jgi:mannose-6-phosphate isomerase